RRLHRLQEVGGDRPREASSEPSGVRAVLPELTPSQRIPSLRKRGFGDERKGPSVLIPRGREGFLLRSVIGSAPEFPGCLKIPGLLEVSGTVFSFSSASFFKEIRIIRLHERFRTASFFLAVAAPLLLGAC